MSTAPYKRQTLTQKNMDLMQEVKDLILKRKTLQDQLKEVNEEPQDTISNPRHLVEHGKALVSQVKINLKSLEGSSQRAREIKILKRKVAVQRSICEKLQLTFSRGMRKLPIFPCIRETKPGELLLLKCGHVYNFKCFIDWFHQHRNCPKCGQKIRRSEIRVARVNAYDCNKLQGDRKHC